MAERPYLTTAEAAEYCGFKTIGGIQQAVRRGKLKPAGRRGGTGTYVFVREDLDAFLTGGLAPHGRLFVPPASEAPAPYAQPAPAPRRTRAAGGAAYSPASSQPLMEAIPPSGRQRKGPGQGERTSTGSVTSAEARSSGADDPVARILRALSGPVKRPVPNKKDSGVA